jgi:hypothetical protein
MFKLAAYHLNLFFYSDSRPGYPARAAPQIKGVGRALCRSLFIAFLRFWLAAYKQMAPQKANAPRGH